ncbi:MAG: glycosyltransferase family 2 protein [Lachnospiraceae bacterium]|nr:glycosyltransferase family 2 protein [Lachnospiraceae bacterium]
MKSMISIIMAAYNAEKTIDQAIESVLSQSYENFELIVINDCSKDQTESIVKQYQSKDKRVKLISNENNQGVSKTRLYGLNSARGNWIAILDSDDKWEEDKLEKQVCLVKKTRAELVFTGSAFMNHEGKRIEGYLHAPNTVDYKTLLKQNVISNSSVLIKKYLYKKYYAVSDNMHEDFAIWLQVLRTGRLAYGIDEPLLTYRLSSNSKSSNKLKAAKMNWNTYRYIGLNMLQAFYYECLYTINGIRKYRGIKE